MCDLVTTIYKLGLIVSLNILYWRQKTLTKILVILAGPLELFTSLKLSIRAENGYNINWVTAERKWEQARLCVFALICISVELFKKKKMQKSKDPAHD